MRQQQYLKAIIAVASLAVAQGSLAAETDPSQRPNIILINADDLGYGEVAGSPMHTPPRRFAHLRATRF